MRELLKKFGRNTGLNIKAVQVYARQLLAGLSIIRKSKIIHADIKLDNILISEAKNVAKLCDFGTACDSPHSEPSPYLVSRFYRAPEISKPIISRSALTP